MDFKKRARFIKRPTRKIVVLPVDWFRVITDLKYVGWSHKAIADAIGVTGSSTISSYTADVSPRYENGEKLVLLWRKETNQYNLPRISH